MDYRWASFEDGKDAVRHAVAEEAATTVCGLDKPSEEDDWRWSDELGNNRPCDNCTEILARRSDVPSE